MPIPTPAPVTITSPVASPTPTAIVRPLGTVAMPTPRPLGNVIVDSQGVIRSIYYAGKSIVVGCALNSTCHVELAPGAEIAGELAPPTGWTVKPDNSGRVPMLLIVPEPGAPETGILVQTKTLTYSLILQIDPTAINAAYGYLFPDSNGHVTVPSMKPYSVSSEDDDTSTSESLHAPLAPAPCPDTYDVIAQNNPPFWPHFVFIEDGGVTITFPATGTLPVAGVPTNDGVPTDLAHLADVSQSGGVNGTDRLVHVLSCYPTIVLYTGFGRDRRAVVLRAHIGRQNVTQVPK